MTAILESLETWTTTKKNGNCHSCHCSEMTTVGGSMHLLCSFSLLWIFLHSWGYVGCPLPSFFQPTLRWFKKLMLWEDLPWPPTSQPHEGWGEQSYCSYNLLDPQLMLIGHYSQTSPFQLRKYIKFKSFPSRWGNVKPRYFDLPGSSLRDKGKPSIPPSSRQSQHSLPWNQTAWNTYSVNKDLRRK